MKPIVFPKYDIGLVITNCKNDQLELLEPWSSTIYTDAEFMKYITLEQPKTSIKLSNRCFSIHADVTNGIEVRIDGNTFNNRDFEYLRNLSQIIQDSGEVGSFELGNLQISINSLDSFEKSLIINKEKKNVKN